MRCVDDRVTVSYPSTDTSTFDHDYYLATHIPLMAAAWKPLTTSVDKGVNGPNAAAVHCTFERWTTSTRRWVTPELAR